MMYQQLMISYRTRVVDLGEDKIDVHFNELNP